jgi:hypothetical protein
VATITLYPSVDIANGSLIKTETGATTNLFQSINDWQGGGSTNDADWISNQNYTTALWFCRIGFPDVPADFATPYGISVKIRYIISNALGDDLCLFNASIDNGGLNLYGGDYVSPYEGNGTYEKTLAWHPYIVNWPVVTAATMNDAYLQLNWEYIRNKGSDALQIKVIAFEITMLYFGSPAKASLGFTGYAPTVQIQASSTYSPPVAEMGFTGYAPTVLPLMPASAALGFTGYAPYPAVGLFPEPPVGTMGFTGYAPTVVQTSQPMHQYPLVGHGKSRLAGGAYTNRVDIDWSGYEVGDGWAYMRGQVDFASPSISSSPTPNYIYEITGYLFWNANSSNQTTEGTPGAWVWATNGGNNLDGWSQYLLIDYIDNTSTGDERWNLWIYEEASGVGKLISSYPPGVTHTTVTPLWYQRGVDNAYIFHTKTSGSSTVPAVYHWTGAAWDAGVTVLAAGAEGVNWQWNFIDWCRPDQSNPDRIYLLGYSTQISNGAFLNFKVLAIDLSNLGAGATVLVNHNAATSGLSNTSTLWFDRTEGYGPITEPTNGNGGYKNGHARREERCFPISIGGSDFYFFRIATAAGNSYFKLTLSPSGWLTAPTYTHWLSNIPTGPVETYPPYYSVRETDHHHILWNQSSGDVYAAMTYVRINAEETGDWQDHSELWWAYRNLSDPSNTWSTPTYVFRYSPASEIESQVHYGGNGGVRGWGTRGPGSNVQVPIVLMTQIMGVGNTINWNALTSHCIQWWLAGPDFVVPKSVTVNIGDSVVVGDTVDTGQIIIAEIQDQVLINDEIASGVFLDGYYDLEATATLANEAITVELSDSVVVSADEDSIYISITVDIQDSVTITEDMDVRYIFFNEAYYYWADTWAADLRALVNAKRALSSLPPVAEIDILRLNTNQSGWKRGVMQTHADDMARTGIYAFNDVAFTDGLETSYDRGALMNCLEHTATFFREPLLASSENGRIVNASTFPSASYLWTTMGWQNWAYWTYAFLTDHDELYLQVGMATGYSSAHPTQERVVYFSFEMTDYEGMPYSGGGGSGEIFETPFTNQRTFSSHYQLCGITWHEELLTLTNEVRAQFGLTPFLLPDAAFWQKFPFEVTRQHSIDMADSQTVDHDSAAFPAGWETIVERGALASYKAMYENILWGRKGGYDPLNPGVVDTHFGVFNDTSMYTPSEAFNAWYNSPGHRANMLAAWPSNSTVYHLLGWEARKYPYPTTITDEYHGVGYAGLEGYVQFFTNNFADVTPVVATIYFNSNWQINGALIELLIEEWDLNCYVDARQSHRSSYSTHVAQAHSASYGARVGADHVAPLYYSFTKAHIGSYTQTVGVKLAHGASYRIWQTVPVLEDHVAGYEFGVSTAHYAPYESNVTVQVQHAGPYEPVGHPVGAHTSSYEDALTVRNDHRTLYESLVALRQSHRGAYEDQPSPRQDHQALYEPTVGMRQSHTGVYEDTPVARMQHWGLYGVLDTVSGQHSSVYEPLGTVRVHHVGSYTVPDVARRAMVSPYEASVNLSAMHSGAYSLMLVSKAAHEGEYANTVQVAQDHSGKFDLMLLNPVRAEQESYYTLLAAVIAEAPKVVSLEVGTASVEVVEVVLSQDEGDPVWVSRVRLAKDEEYVLFEEGMSVTLAIGTDEWELVVTEKSVARRFSAAPDLQLKLESPIVMLMSPRAGQSAYRNETAMGAKALVEQILGQSVTWEIQDWTIGAGLLAVDSAEPYEVAKQIVEVAGGIIQSNPDGTLVVRYYAPVPMNRLSEGSPDLTLTDIEDIFEVSNSYTYRSGMNRVRVVQGDTSFRDTLDWIPSEEDPTRGVLRVYPSPWRTDVAVHSTDSYTTTVKTRVGTQTETLTEQVVFQNGVANVSKPVASISSVVWLSDSLGNPVHTAYSTSLSASTTVHSGYGLALITYVSRFIEYELAGVLGDTELYVLESEV